MVRRRLFYRKRPTIKETKTQVSLLLGFVGFIVLGYFYQEYKTYALLTALLIILLIYFIYKILQYRETVHLFHNNTYEQLITMDPFDFEHLCAQIVRQLEYQNITITQSRRDGGVDIWCYKKNILYAIQCKRYSGSTAVTVSEMRALYGSARPKGANSIMMTTGRCTKDAVDYAKENNIKIREQYDFHTDFVKRLQKTPTFRERYKINII